MNQKDFFSSLSISVIELLIDELFHESIGRYLERLKGQDSFYLFNLDLDLLFFQVLQVYDVDDCVFL
jgi:hypothetical protein